MFAISLQTAKTVAVVAAVVFVVLAIASAWLVRSVVAKVVTIALLAGLAALTWSQRSNLVDCADRAEEQLSNGQTGVTCEFFGTEVSVNE